MGAWDTGNFSDDSALDWVEGLEDRAQIDATLRAAEPGMDADEASEVLAACDLVAAMLGRPASDMPEAVASLLDASGAPDGTMLEAARKAVAQVRAASELAELWAEDPEQETEWHATLDDLLARLDPARSWTPPEPDPDGPAGEIGGHCFLCHKSGTEAEIVALTHDYDDGIVSSSMTLYAHRTCVEDRFEPPHWTADGTPDPALLERFAAMLEEGL